MTDGEYQIILVKKKVNNYSVDDVKVDTDKVTLQQLLDDPDLQNDLVQLGWVNTKKLSEQEKKLIPQKEFYLIQGVKCAYSVNRTSYTATKFGSLDQLTSSQRGWVFTENVIVQAIDPESALPLNLLAEYKKYIADVVKHKKQIEVAAKKRTATAAARKIEKAKKVLEAAGVKVIDKKEKKR